jgi:hypothetical protein
VFKDDPSAVGGLELDEETETFCNVCTWHGKLGRLKAGS